VLWLARWGGSNGGAPLVQRHLAEVIERFTEMLGLAHYALYVFDYGAPIGFRLAVRHPERITALNSQNGNAYLEGLSEGGNPIQAYWKDPSPENRAALRAFLKPEATQWQYMHGVPNRERLSPDAWTLDSALLARPGNDEIQLDLWFFSLAPWSARLPRRGEGPRQPRWNRGSRAGFATWWQAASAVPSPGSDVIRGRI
jgi:pimeloyl-ACP methyl ester carboxylesterase